MYSNQPWPLLWQHALSGPLWPNYPTSIRSRQCSVYVPGTHLDADVNRMRKTKEHSVLRACVMAFLGHFAWMNKFCLLRCVKGSLFLLLHDDNGCWHLDWGGRDVTRNLFVTAWQFLKLGKLLRRSCSWWNLLSWNVGWWYNRGASAVEFFSSGAQNFFHRFLDFSQFLTAGRLFIVKWKFSNFGTAYIWCTDWIEISHG